MKYYIYAHRRNDTGEIFYIGKGCGKRAWKKSDRSEWWKRVEAKNGRTVEIISRGLSENDAFELEQLVISEIGREHLCNLRDGGLGGISPSESTRLKLSLAHKGRTVSDETREKKRIAGLGRKHSEETRAKIKAARALQKMAPMSDEARAKISAAKKGLLRSPEHCAAISSAKKGVSNGPMSADTKEKLRQVNLGRKHTEESIAKMSAAQLGKKLSPETIAKLTISNQRLNAARRKPIKCSNGMVFSYTREAEAWLRDNGYPSAGRSNIASCCSGKLKSAYGFTWQFA